MLKKSQHHEFKNWFDQFATAADAGDVPDYRITNQVAKTYYQAGFRPEAAVFSEQQRQKRVYNMAISL